MRITDVGKNGGRERKKVRKEGKIWEIYIARKKGGKYFTKKTKKLQQVEEKM